MPFPLVSVDVYDVLFACLSRGHSVLTGMASMFIIVALVIAELALQVSHGPEEGLIK
jgi:hypothetical protein